MGSQILIVPFSEEILNKTSDRDVIFIFRGHNTEGLQKYDFPNERLKGLILISENIRDIKIDDIWKDIPIKVFLQRTGTFHEIKESLPILRKLRIMILLPSDIKESYTQVNILSSLGVYSGIYFTGEDVDWDALNDLMHYSVYTMVNHAPVEPFHYIISHYAPGEEVYFNRIYWNDPEKFLYADKQENIALSYENLKNKKYIASGLRQNDDLENNEFFISEQSAWQDHFLNRDECSFCPSWRLCHGYFSSTDDKSNRCKSFFADLQDAADHVFSLNNKSNNAGPDF